MKIVKATEKEYVAFGDLKIGTIFSPVNFDDCFYMKCYGVRDCGYMIEDTLNAMDLDSDGGIGVVVHFDDDDMVIPYYNCTLEVS